MGGGTRSPSAPALPTLSYSYLEFASYQGAVVESVFMNQVIERASRLTTIQSPSLCAYLQKNATCFDHKKNSLSSFAAVTPYGQKVFLLGHQGTVL